MSLNVEDIVSQLALLPHPEGGFYKETYRCTQTTNLASGQTRSTCTAIYFLLVAGNFSAFHRIQSEEIWHYYSGSTIHLHIISPKGDYSLVRIGSNLMAGEVPQYLVPAHHWFASEVITAHALCGCTVSPGFDFADFELANSHELTQKFPTHTDLIKRLTRD